MTEVLTKRVKMGDNDSGVAVEEAELPEKRRCMIQLVSERDEPLGGALDVQLDVSQQQLQTICNLLLKQAHATTDAEEAYEAVPCQFYLDRELIRENLKSAIALVHNRSVADEFDLERVLNVVYEPQAVFRCVAVTRCTSSLPGHAEPIVSVQFSPDARYLASGSGDCTVRMWDLSTELPQYTCTGHDGWVLCISWAPSGSMLASACKAGQVRLWNPVDGKQIGPALTGHKQWITSLAWQPLHETGQSRLLASGGKDGTVRIWDTTLYKCERILSGHTQCITCVRWGGTGLIYSASQDRTIKVWRAADGVMCRTLSGHGHWVNTMALHTDYVLRTGAFEPARAQTVPGSQTDGMTVEQVRVVARRRFDTLMAGESDERLVSGSDDFTLFLWRPNGDKKPIARMTGHMQLVNQVAFSCDGRQIASASFDKSIKVWCGRTGTYLATLRGHVQAVYQIAFAPDSRLLVSASKDSTLKVSVCGPGDNNCVQVWNLSTLDVRAQTTAPAVDLPGHGDEVFAVDWAPDAQRVASGAKDKLLRIWRR